ncbi:hypothetical protein D910_06500 [Dendroctonus ponderosae]|uniref:Uncharacterized protein n=1 Tax=Dendroctonus ponderosae TaxID=77166 RepID=U4U5F6_DENPD|nr:hypothetical protein D910_06500 [Dendroctonus ponderosae]
MENKTVWYSMEDMFYKPLIDH